MPNQCAQFEDKRERALNSFATQSFRDQADRDYIAARLACRAELYPQFLWAAQQAVEKYLKAILLYNRIKAPKVGHNLMAAMEFTKQLPFVIELSPRSQKFIDHLSECGEFRYLDVPYHVDGHLILDVDLTVWELRRYCQVLYCFERVLPPREQELLEQSRRDLVKSSSEPRYKYRLHGGILETILDTPKHPSRPGLIWQNACYGTRSRSTVRVKDHMHAQNPILFLYPEMLDTLLEYVSIGRLAGSYRKHLETTKAKREKRTYGE